MAKICRNPWSWHVLARGSWFEHLQGHTYVTLHNTGSYTKRACDKIYVYLWVYACTSRGSKCEHSQGHTYVTSHNMGSSTNVSAIWYMYTCEYMHVYQEVLSVSTRKGINICELFQHGFIYKRICDMIFVYLWVYASISRGSKCEHSQEHKHMWAWTTRVHIRTYLW